MTDAVTALFEGISSAIVAYGSTGSGKTYTMAGEEFVALERLSVDELMIQQMVLNHFNVGIVGRAIAEFFCQLDRVEDDRCKAYVSMY